jgi:hypothetical protein
MGRTSEVTASNTYIHQELQQRLSDLESRANADVLTIIADILPPIDDLVRDVVEARRAANNCTQRENVFVILETGGGSIETAERLADLLRHHWKGEVSFVIPNFAMSAGTILVMSGDHIFMDYFSVLGPIDPQVPSSSGGYVPALGYLEKYSRLIEKSKKGNLTAAELTFLIEKFDPAELDLFEKARDLSIDLLKKWLVQYKFKNWKVTRTRQIPVTQPMKIKRATEIAKKLNDVTKWKSHSRGISIQVLTDDLKVLVENFGTDQKWSQFNTSLRAYYRLLRDYMNRRGWELMIQSCSSHIAAGDNSYEAS